MYKLKEIEEWLAFIPTDEKEYRVTRYLLDTVKMLQQERDFLKRLEVVELKYGKLAEENDKLREALEKLISVVEDDDLWSNDTAINDARAALGDSYGPNYYQGKSSHGIEY